MFACSDTTMESIRRLGEHDDVQGPTNVMHGGKTSRIVFLSSN
jgi:hypothetical protein